MYNGFRNLWNSMIYVQCNVLIVLNVLNVLRALPSRGVRGHAPRKILKFYSRGDVFSCILKLQTVTFK